MWKYLRVVHSEKMKAPYPFSRFCPIHLFQMPAPNLYSCKVNVSTRSYWSPEKDRQTWLLTRVLLGHQPLYEIKSNTAKPGDSLNLPRTINQWYNSQYWLKSEDWPDAQSWLTSQDLNTFEHPNTRLTRVRKLTMLTLARPCELDLELLP